MESEEKKFSLKDDLFNEKLVKYLSGLIHKAYPKLNQSKFEKDIISKFPELELMERVYWIRENLDKHIEGNFKETITILLNSLKDKSTKEAFIFASYSDYIAVNGCNKKYLKKSLKTLGEFTGYFSAEFAIRPFLNNFPEETFSQMTKWSTSKNEHQRRLASEGLRPKLPWGKSIKFDYKKGAEPLDNLFYDASRYVTRSVTNHLNDISKIDPIFILDKLQKWKKSQKQNDDEMNYIINHLLRTLIKKGNDSALQYLGFNSNPNISIKKFIIEDENINIGGTLEFSFEINSANKENLIVDYKVTYPTPNNKISEKVFKIKKVITKADERILIEKKHPFRKMTTKKLYTGKYQIGIQINGSIYATKHFYLKV